eukprot:3681547-Amphidinium_carterae.2
MRTGSKRWEVPMLHPQDRPPLLHVVCDEGSDNLHALQFLTGKLGLRLTWSRDPSHRCWNDFRGACEEMELMTTVWEYLHGMSVKFGPSRSEAWFQACITCLGLHVCSGEA